MEFQKTNLGELSVNGKGSYGIAASAVPYSDELFTYLRITDINDDGTLNKSGLMSVSDEKAEQYLLKPNDIVFARTGGSTGRSYFYDGTDGEFVYAGFLIKFSIDSTKVNPRFIKYYCLSQEYRGWVHSFNTGSTRGNINAQTYANMPILLPSREQQDLLVDTLSVIDEKIKLNTAINENLEQQAQAIFKSWFVDFEPFGGAMPDDWAETTLGTIAAISTKSINPLKQPDLYLEHYSIPAYDEQHYPVFEYASEVKSNKYILTNNSVMISKLNPDTKRIWRPLCLSANPVCSTEFIVYEAVNPKYKDYIYSLIDSQAFSDYLCAHTTGSTNSRQRATPKTTLDYTCIMPSDDIITRFCGIVTPMYDQIASNIIESQRLAALRDTLLPKLMNGEIDVSAVKI